MLTAISRRAGELARLDQLVTPMPRSAVLLDYLEPDLDAVFVGTAVGIRSGAVGGYYAGRGNQFWELLYRSGERIGAGRLIL